MIYALPVVAQTWSDNAGKWSYSKLTAEKAQSLSPPKTQMTPTAARLLTVLPWRLLRSLRTNIFVS
jgi:hypothetical protein